MTDCLTAIEALAIHADQITRYGSAPGIHDSSLLETALFRPQTGYYSGLIEEATALLESMAQNHPFIDGNRRAAFAVTWTFFAINDPLASSVPRITTFVDIAQKVNHVLKPLSRQGYFSGLLKHV